MFDRGPQKLPAIVMVRMISLLLIVIFGEFSKISNEPVIDFIYFFQYSEIRYYNYCRIMISKREKELDATATTKGRHTISF